jgi:hypothetical protein
MHQNPGGAAPLSNESTVSSPAAPDAGAPVPPQSAAAIAREHALFSRWSIYVASGVVVLIPMALMSIIKWSSVVKPPEAQPADLRATRHLATDSRAIVEPAPARHWVGRRQATWARDGSKEIAFEMQASNEVPVWMTRVRPTLVVRCLSRTTDVFVAMGTSASLEAQTDSHAVRVQMDNEPEELQRWSGSESQQELFAPDGPELVRRLARAQRMRVGFKPYNAPPVTADFLVQGFDQLAGLVAGTCGWRMDAPVPASARPISLEKP